MRNFFTRRQKYTHAFTLAETLITLAIIGIVAALTIPTVVMKYKEKVIVTKVKKAYSMLNSAYKMALVNNGEFNTWGFGEESTFEEDDDGNTILTGSTIPNTQLFWEKLTPSLNIIEKCMPEQTNCYRPDDLYNLNGKSRKGEINKYAFLTLNNGMTLIGGWVNNISCQKKNDVCADFSIDVNGIQNAPNSVGQDIFYFYVYPDRIEPLGKDPDYFLNNCNRTKLSNTQNGYGCTAWVIQNENMDYLHCDDLSWEGKHKCSDKN